MTAPQLSTRQMHNFALNGTLLRWVFFISLYRCHDCNYRHFRLSFHTSRLSPRPRNGRSVNCRRKFEVREVAEDHRRTTLNSLLRREVARVGAGFAAGVGA